MDFDVLILLKTSHWWKKAASSQKRVQPRADDGGEVGEGVGLASMRALTAGSAPGKGLEVGAT